MKANHESMHTSRIQIKDAQKHEAQAPVVAKHQHPLITKN